MPCNDYDSPWKDAVSRYFPDFMAFYFPRAHAAIDWRQPHVFLDQELAQVARDAELGRRLVDKLVRVSGLGGEQEWVLVHVEVQGGRDSHFAERILTYNYRLYDRHRRPVASLALLTDGSARWRPLRFGYRLFGCDMRLRFPIVKLSDYARHLERLLRHPNPFALVTAAHLLSERSKNDPPARAEAKWRLARRLYQRQWDKQHIIDLFKVIDSMMRLPAELDAKLWSDLAELERRNTMPYLTSIERIGLERGLERGRLEGQAMVLGRLLSKRFGPLPEPVRERLALAQAAQLDAWTETLLDAATLDEVFRTD